jgi:glycine/D-amino acid oxidase-like deaminating enzyme
MDVLVIGAGVVGLAVARALALHRHAVIVTEATGAASWARLANKPIVR